METGGSGRKRPANHAARTRANASGPLVKEISGLAHSVVFGQFATAGASRLRVSNQRSGNQSANCSAVGASHRANSPGSASRRYAIDGFGGDGLGAADVEDGHSGRVEATKRYAHSWRLASRGLWECSGIPVMSDMVGVAPGFGRHAAE